MFTKTSLLACSAVIGLGSVAAWPVKTIDESQDGALCDTSKEQYIQVEGYDFHEHPKFTMRWRQVSGVCGAAVSDPVSWEQSYDPDQGDEATSGGRVQLNIFVCAPFGHYEIDLDVESYSDPSSDMQKRTAWELENGEDEYHIWDTVNTYLQTDEEYSPTVPGAYTWPLDGETGYYKVLYTGPLPPIQCDSSVPSGTEYKGCFEDSKSNRLLNSNTLVLGEQGRDGMTTQICSDYCADYDYFGVEYGKECYCGTAEEYAAAVSSDQCGLTYQSLCTGDSTTACGGRNSISVYERGAVTPPSPTPPPVNPTPPTPTTSESYASVGCYADSKNARIMTDKQTPGGMTTDVCFGLCNKDSNTHFGTQYGTECWCAEDPNLTANAPELTSGECSFDCEGDDTKQCGGYNAMSSYQIGGYIGCYGDSKDARVMGNKLYGADMTNEVCQGHCAGYEYYGTQYGVECWCGDTYDTYGTVESCTVACGGNADEKCGGYNALSVYNV